MIKSDPTAISSWGGWAMQGGLRTGSATLIKRKDAAEILVGQVNAPDGATYFSGNEPYPRPSKHRIVIIQELKCVN